MLTKRRELLVTVLHLRSPVAFKTPLVSGRNGIRCNPGAGRFTSRILCCERNSQTRRGELIFFRGLSPHQSQRLGSEFLFRHGSHFVHPILTLQSLRVDFAPRIVCKPSVKFPRGNLIPVLNRNHRQTLVHDIQGGGRHEHNIAAGKRFPRTMTVQSAAMR